MRTKVAVSQSSNSPVRRWPRYRVDVPVRLLKSNGRNGDSAVGHGTDLNSGGLRVFALLELAPGDRIAIEFTPPYSGKLITIQGVVRNRRGHTYGVEFIMESDSDCENVAQLQFSFARLGSAAYGSAR